MRIPNIRIFANTRDYSRIFAVKNEYEYEYGFARTREYSYSRICIRYTPCLLGIQTRASTAFHPQTDGQTERVNQEIEQYLRIFSNHRQDDWSEWIPLAEFAYNNRVHASTCLTPFQMDNGQNPRMG